MIKKILIIIIPLVVIIIIMIINFTMYKPYKNSCDKNSDCNTDIGETCQFDPDYNKKMCLRGKYCLYIPDTELLECDLANINSCDICNNQPSYKCVEVTADKPYKINTEGKTIEIKNSNVNKGWCLIPIEENSKCNPFTSDTILTETSKGNYKWSCNCKYPNLVQQSIIGENCNNVVACNVDENLGDLYIKTDKKCSSSSPCDNTEKCNTDDNFCYKLWGIDQNEDPTKGICICNNDAFYEDLTETKLCVSDNCSPNGTTTPDGKQCNCNTGFISCPGDLIANPTIREGCNNKKPICINDPCGPNGKADVNNGCKCDDGYIKYPVASSETNWICKKGCTDDYSFCADRGSCYVDDETKTEKCKCDCPYSNADADDVTCSALTGLKKDWPCEVDGDYNNCNTCCNHNGYYTSWGHNYCN
jgi:hypothetical protein